MFSIYFTIGDYLYMCYVCNKKYATKGKLDFHMKTHQEAQYECALCNKRFSTQQYLNYHMKVHPDQVCVLTNCNTIKFMIILLSGGINYI